MIHLGPNGEFLPILSGIDPYSRTQPGLKSSDMFPHREDGLCACGCGKIVPRPPRLRWHSNKCRLWVVDLYFIHTGSSNTIRHYLYLRDEGVCIECGGDRVWEADHILAVKDGGGGCGLDNFQTLCTDCHKAKTAEGRRRKPDPQQTELV